ncbi:uncharacterized protein [Typha latifolia]|uniref:uncharacterized protein isoform X1 n=1 Tax=Typha latifolia TaxID=4733 RepID=UPI003C2E0F37
MTYRTPMAMSTRYLVVNGVPRGGEVPPISTFLESVSGAYTTTRTDVNATLLLFWDRHLSRLSDSVRLLAGSRPDLLGLVRPRAEFSPAVEPLVSVSLRTGLELALAKRRIAEREDELAITTLVRSREDDEEGIDVYLHLGFYVPPVFGLGGAHLAVAGRGRDVAMAKYSDWARMRKGLEKMRPPLATELLLTNDGNRILEGSVTNFFVVCRKMINQSRDEPSSDQQKKCMLEVQTAPISDGVLPGIMRQLVIEVCSSIGIPLRETAPSWSDRDLWEEAFVTSSLRLVQHVETIQAPSSCEELHLQMWKEVSWIMKKFEGAGHVTAQIQREVTERARSSGYEIRDVC